MNPALDAAKNAAAGKIRKHPIVPSAGADSQSKKQLRRQPEGWLYPKVRDFAIT
jgi:hypothetical protein